MNRADEEILRILKETFLEKKDKYSDPDERLRCLILKVMLFILVIFLITLAAIKDIPSGFGTLVSMHAALFFGGLFMRLNARSENFSVLMAVLTWVSTVFGLYFAGS